MENQVLKSIHNIPVPPGLAEQIEEVLEMLRRVKRVQLARGNQEIQENYGNTYVLPEPVYYPVTKPSS